MTLFQHETGAGPAAKFQPLVAAGVANDLGAGIRSSYAILSIKAGKWRIKYKGNETPIVMQDPQSGQNVPVPTLEVVIVKANSFLNKQFYAGKYVEGSTAPPDCFSLDGKVPDQSVKNPVFSSCALCPKNQWGSMVSESGVKQKACRDSKKLAIVPLKDIYNKSLGGAMLMRVPGTSLKGLSSMADALSARGFPYNSVAVRLGFDMDASHPKPTFSAIRPLNDEEADAVLEMFESDSVAAVLADNDVVHEAAATPVRDPGAFEQEPQHAPVSPPAAQPAPAPVANAVPEAEEAPTRFAAAPVPPPPPGMRGAAVQPFSPGAPPPPNPFAQPAPAPATPAPQAAAAPPKPRKTKPVAETPAASVEPAAEPPVDQANLATDVGAILAGLSAFTGGK
jgi:hypothetical protein